MSSDEAENKNIEENTEENESSAEEIEEKKEEVTKKPTSKKKADPPKIKQPAKKRAKTEQAEKGDSKKEDKKETKKKAEKEEDGDVEEAGEKNDIGNHKVPLLDQPLEIAGSRKRKEVQRFIPVAPEDKQKELAIPEGKGKPLGEVEIILYNIQRAKMDDVTLLHKLCFGTRGKNATVKKDVKKFNGFDFEEASDDYEKKKTTFVSNKKITVAHLKNVCNILAIERGGSKEEIVDRILSFLVSPVDSGKKLPGQGRSKRKGTSGKNYDEGDERFDKKKNKGKKKVEEEEEEEEEDEEVTEEEKDESEDNEEEEKKVVKTKASGKKKPQKNEKKNDVTTEESEPEEEEKEEEKPKRGVKKGGKKAAELAEKKAPPKKRAAAKKAAQKELEDEEDKEEETTEDEEPAAKKSKTPPTEEDLKTYIKSLLEGADLEKVTMKKVCQDVFAHYPEFDLGHKKDFIKTTVKNLIV